LYINHESADLFQIGDWWYLLYSTYSERWVTHYRMSRNLQGPWLAPANDTFDARSFYAAKTSTDGQRRFLSGWLPTRKDEKDDGEWQWGGSLVVNELVQQPDGRLAVRPPDTVVGAFGTRHPLQPKAVLGPWQVEGEHISGGAVGQGATILLADLPETGLIEANVSFTHATGTFGFLLRADEALEHYYVVRFEPARQRVVFDRWPRPGDQPFMLEQPVILTAGQALPVRILVDGTCAVVYAGDQTVLSCRMYEHRSGKLGLFANEVEASFAAVTLASQG
jgi:beta-fructofuranosidase